MLKLNLSKNKENIVFAVVRHTYQIEIPEPTSYFSRKSTAKWVHKVWIFEEKLDAITYAISLLDDPLVKASDYMFETAIYQLKENNFYQLGRESIAIAEVLDSPTIIYEQDLDELSEKLDDLNDKIEKEITGENNGRDTKKLIH